MRYLYIGAVNGLCKEMYNPQIDALLNPKLAINLHKLEANNHFWSLIFDSKNLNKLLRDISVDERKHPAKVSILQHKDFFIKKVFEAYTNVCNRNNSPQQFFAYLETLNLVCQFYSEYMYFPHTLTIQEGFAMNITNSKTIWEECTNPAKNPYLIYVQENIFPLIKEYNPQLIFLEGAPTYYNMCLAKLIKQNMPSARICVTRHSSEYYSLNKIDYLLRRNHYFFKMVDIVILEYFSETEEKLIENIPLEQIDNILYRDKERNIFQNKYCNSLENKNIFYQMRPQNAFATAKTDPAKLANVHLEPYTKCFWNKCSFCGINKKYHFENTNTNDDLLPKRLEELRQLVLKGISYIWFIDEAISVDKLRQIAEFLIKNHVSIIWQVRSRICNELTDGSLIQLLESSGLKEIRLGLESASIPVLKRMNKFDETFSLNLVEDICKKFDKHNISVHFPIIIGFPGETVFDRKCTYEFLRYLHEKYPLVTFNINLFGLDICSPMFSKWISYEIEHIYFPCIPDYFIGNIVGWSGKNNFTSALLASERDNTMKDILYPWMPKNATLPPYIFYRLSETIRNTLYWKENPEKTKKELDEKSILEKNRNVTISYKREFGIYIIYNWFNHHYMIGNANTLQIFRVFNTPHTVEKAIHELCLFDGELFKQDELQTLIKKLFSLDYLTLNAK